MLSILMQGYSNLEILSSDDPRLQIEPLNNLIKGQDLLGLFVNEYFGISFRL